MELDTLDLSSPKARAAFRYLLRQRPGDKLAGDHSPEIRLSNEAYKLIREEDDLVWEEYLDEMPPDIQEERVEPHPLNCDRCELFPQRLDTTLEPGSVVTLDHTRDFVIRRLIRVQCVPEENTMFVWAHGWFREANAK